MTTLTPQLRLAELNRRMLAGETVTDDEIKEAIAILRSDRAERTKGKKEKVEATQAKAAAGEDILNNLI